MKENKFLQMLAKMALSLLLLLSLLAMVFSWDTGL